MSGILAGVGVFFGIFGCASAASLGWHYSKPKWARHTVNIVIAAPASEMKGDEGG